MSFLHRILKFISFYFLSKEPWIDLHGLDYDTIVPGINLILIAAREQNKNKFTLCVGKGLHKYIIYFRK